MRRITRAMIVIATLTAGCATVPKYKNSTAPDAACIKGNFASLGDWFSKGEAHIKIKEIDGTPTDGKGPFCFAPGKHQLGIYAINNYQEAQDYLDLDLAPSRKYWLHGNLRGISFVVQFDDITTQPPKNVAAFRLKAGSSGQPIAVPIFIPAR
jgi:hypothetical protein